MSGHMSEEFNIQKIAAWGLVIALGSVVLIVCLVAIAASAAHVEKAVDQEAVMTRIAPVAKVALAAAVGGGAAQSRTGEAVYNLACAACHVSGAAGAPKIGDSGAWGPRLKQGLDGLVKAVIAGKGAMPPKGGSDASDVELARAVVYLTNKSGAKFDEPK